MRGLIAGAEAARLIEEDSDVSGLEWRKKSSSEASSYKGMRWRGSLLSNETNQVPGGESSGGGGCTGGGKGKREWFMDDFFEEGGLVKKGDLFDSEAGDSYWGYSNSSSDGDGEGQGEREGKRGLGGTGNKSEASLDDASQEERGEGRVGGRKGEEKRHGEGERDGERGGGEEAWARTSGCEGGGDEDDGDDSSELVFEKLKAAKSSKRDADALYKSAEEGEVDGVVSSTVEAEYADIVEAWQKGAELGVRRKHREKEDGAEGGGTVEGGLGRERERERDREKEGGREKVKGEKMEEEEEEIMTDSSLEA